MSYVKVCPTCTRINNRNAIVCDQCSQVISSVKPVEEQTLLQTNQESIDESMQNDSTMPVLTLRLGNGTPVPIGKSGVIGREADYGSAELKTYDTVSRHHCRIVLERGVYTVTDEDSTNGTYLNGKRLTVGHPVSLKRGDILGLGLEVRLEVL